MEISAAPTDTQNGFRPRVSAGVYAWSLAVFLVVLTAYRFWALWQADLQLYFDEAYYWGWSRELALGYYSKPPMIAWAIRGATEVCGESELCIRSVPLLLFAATAGLLFGIGSRLFGPRVGFLSGLVFASLPAVSFYSWLTTTDSLLLFFWALALYGLVRALQTGRWTDWLVAGIGLGSGLLSKYTMLVFLVSTLIFPILAPQSRRALISRRAGWALALAAAIFLPNIVWNIFNDSVSFRHTAEKAGWSGNPFHPDHLLEFLGGQFLLFGPVLAVVLLAALARLRRSLWADERYRLLVCFVVPLILIYSVQAFVSRAHFNWAAAALVPASVLAAAALVRLGWNRTLIAAVAINFMSGLAMYHYGSVMERAGIALTRKTDLHTWMKGWRELGEEVGAIMALYPDAGLASDNRRVLAELIYYVRPHPLDAAIWNPSGKQSDNFRLKSDIKDSRRESFVFVAGETPPEAIRAAFAEVEDLGPMEIPLYADYGLRYRVFLVRKFSGYPK